MPTVNLFIKGTKNPCTIYLRFKSGGIDISKPTGIAVNPKNWDKKNKKIRNVIEEVNREEINARLVKLQLSVVDQYNLSYSSGEVIDSEWLKNAISKFFNRPEKGDSKALPWKIYLTDFCRWWMENKKPEYRNADGSMMNERTAMQYEAVIDNLEKYEKHIKKRLKLSALVPNDFIDIGVYFIEVEKYATASAKRKVGRVKFFCKQAEIENLQISKSYMSRVVVKDTEPDYKHPYLNEQEISSIFKLDLSYNKELDTARDNFIIGLWTGLRISDFLTRLSIENIQDGFIDIKTLKTGHAVSIPLHPQVKEVLKKHKGKLPPKITEQRFNELIKTICRIADIDEEILGGISEVDKSTKLKRKKIGVYKKYLLVTSHICRRSMATNLFGKIENKVIMDVCGWASEKQMFSYNKATNRESAVKLQKHWEKQHETNR